MGKLNFYYGFLFPIFSVSNAQSSIVLFTSYSYFVFVSAFISTLVSSNESSWEIFFFAAEKTKPRICGLINFDWKNVGFPKRIRRKDM